MLLLWIFALMCFADVSQGQTTYYMEAPLGGRVTFLCRVGSSWYEVLIRNAKEDLLYSFYESERIARVTYPDKHETNTTRSSSHYFTIKKADFEDARTYICYSRGSIHSKFVLDVYVMDNSDLINTVLEEGTFLRLAYHTKMENDTSVQWAFQRPRQPIRDIYYADEEIGWVLPNFVGVFQESDIGYGVVVRSMSVSAGGKYQYFVVNPPDQDQKVFEVAWTRHFGCNRAPYLIEGEEQFHTCSAEVSHGSIEPEFTILRNGEVMEGTRISYDNSSSIKMYIYNQTFVASSDDIRVDFSCLIKFKYHGKESNYSEFLDTTDPVYSNSCGFRYSTIQFGVKIIDIFPNSDDNPLILRIGEHLSCDGFGVPAVKYRWTCKGLTTIYNAHYLKITESFFNLGIRSCECNASNTLSNGKTYSLSKEVEFQIAHTNDLLTLPQQVIFQPIGQGLHLDCTLAPYINSTAYYGGTYRYQWTADFSDDEDFIKHLIYTGKGDRYGIQDLWSDYFQEGKLRHDLVMKSADFGLAGRYRCEVINMESPDMKYYYSDVNIVDAVKCITPKKKIKRGETARMKCQIEHSGSVEPEIVWYADDCAVSVQLIQGSVKTLRKEFSSVKQVGVSVPVEPGVTYKCAVSFRSGTSTYTDECIAVIDFDEEDGPNQQKPENKTNKQ